MRQSDERVCHSGSEKNKKTLNVTSSENGVKMRIDSDVMFIEEVIAFTWKIVRFSCFGS